MRRKAIEELVQDVCIGPEFCLEDLLASDLGDRLRSLHGPTGLPKDLQPLRPFSLSRYEGQGLISLTYDDGHLDNFVLAAPLHLRYRIPANFAVVAKRLLQRSYYTKFMSPLMCRVLVELGFEISSHGLLHSKFLQDMTLKELHREGYLSKSVIERVVGVPDSVRSYCVPFSRVGSLHADYLRSFYPVVRQAGKTMNDIPIQRRRCISSFPLTNDVSFETAKALIDDAIETRRALVFLLHGIAADEVRPDEFELPERLLNQILCYVAEQGPRRILPVRLSEYQYITRTAVRDAQRCRVRNSFVRNIRETWSSFKMRQP